MISHEIIYNIAPAANERENPINALEIFPIIAPKKVPIPVLIPESAVRIIDLCLLIPPVFNGKEIEIPSGMS